MRTVLSVQLHTDERTIGALNLYSRTAGSFTTSDAAVAMTFARHASIALASSDEIFHLRIAVDSRKTVGQAQGILMERFNLDPSGAWSVLRRLSTTSNRKVNDIAEEIVRTRKIPEIRASGRPAP